MAKAVFCISETAFQAETILTDLKDRGFGEGTISTLLRNFTGNTDFRTRTGWAESENGPEPGRRAGVSGSSFSWLSGMELLAIPAAGSFVAAGPILAALRAVTVGAGAGGIAGVLVGMGLSEVQARRQETKIRSGKIFISVHTNTADEAGRAKRIFEVRGASDIASAGEPASKPEPVKDDPAG